MDYTYLKGWPAITGIQIDSKKLERLNPNRRRTRNTDSKSTTFKQYIPKEILREIGLQLYPPKTQLPLYLFNASEDSTTNANIAFLTKDKTTIATWIGSTNRVIFSEKSYLGIPIFALDSLSSFDLVISTKSTPRSVLGTKTIQRSELPFFEVSLPLSNQLLESTSIFHTQFYLVELETEILENKGYNLELKSNDQVIYSLNFETYWQDMPTSLLQLDVAIEMLRYIMPEKMIEDVLKKNQEEKLTWFNSFWESKDPIPTTAKNELMSEYYRRIDYAFDQYSTTSKPEGYDSDQGQIYIKIGPPREIVRSFPTNGRVIEEWIYPNRTFVFTASSGFGDFTLINANQEN
jgi:GWxTD domain-containing protein